MLSGPCGSNARLNANADFASAPTLLPQVNASASKSKPEDEGLTVPDHPSGLIVTPCASAWVAPPPQALTGPNVTGTPDGRAVSADGHSYEPSRPRGALPGDEFLPP